MVFSNWKYLWFILGTCLPSVVNSYTQLSARFHKFLVIYSFFNQKRSIYLPFVNNLCLLAVRKESAEMPRDDLSFFDEKRGVIKAKTEWGYWWQTVQEVHIQVTLPEGVKSKDIKVNVKPKHIQCIVQGKTIFEGPLPRTVYAEESVWTIEDGILCILLAKADYSVKEDMWESLLGDNSFQPDAWTLHEMRKNLDLERFQIENPGMDFSKAQLSKSYDKLPGWSNDRLAELKKQSEEAESSGQSQS